MSKVHLLRVAHPVVEFERLIAAARHQGERVGWLELPAVGSESEPLEPLPASLQAAASQGVMRAVAISGGRSVAVKPMAGPPVLQDVLREHFRGCRLVLVQGAIDEPLVEPSGDAWRITVRRQAGAEPTLWTTDRLVAALAKPHPW
ncbi:MAG: hypothetical protein AAF657_04010 [Acidobacteriota bacterium]